MPIKREKNDEGGWSYRIPAGTPLDAFPDPVLALLDEQDRAIFVAPDAHLAAILADRPKDALSQWVRLLRKGGMVGLEAHFAPEVGPGIESLYFRFRKPREKLGTNLRFSKSIPDDTIPPSLASVFRVFEEVDCDFLESHNRITHPAHAEPFTVMGWTEPSDEIDVSRCMMLYSDSCGDVIGWHADGRAVACKHGRVSVIGTIAEFLNVYFVNLSQKVGVCSEVDDYIRLMAKVRELVNSEDV